MLKAEGISYNNRTRPVLLDIGFSVEKGSILAVLGISGAGKTTLLRILAGLVRPEAGEVWQDGKVVNGPDKWVAPHARKVAMIFQSLALWPYMTVRQHLAFVMGNGGGKKSEKMEKIDAILLELGLPKDRGRYPETLSGGEKQRLAMARAIAQDPAYLLMDEPFSQTDDVLKKDLLDLVRRFKSRAGIIYVTHNIAEAMAVADEILVLSHGTVAKAWKKDEIKCISRDDILRFLR
ncbi:MAG: ATP-binding cassette domain-containing protein [Deltaproteobacteria bacterium]|nr:ATP-binding cassette domain-containing protein [Deltaproteobacteria bacterium]